eukprot:CAMPEP_0170524320 /NCGR_PEP_ID=MMETSP0209-20121228/9748_1 /TAXON_ID=665100 ORGANISM="Litonotus pictus, Strain P1" /NCGR_SAMPLE_ID=MMETSP0209 /ASSEMBLY_ACC=CAM_ASM_000301 /LENGTH=113 /DNA_ID=CAMNT_0010812917 /DNA_START=131 /DNA_END=469 /DNA_ORIENTATION=+
MIVYHDSKPVGKEYLQSNSLSENYKNIKNQEQFIASQEELESLKRINLIREFEASVSSFEETYYKIIEDHSYVNEIKESFLVQEIDEMLDNVIDIVNDYRTCLHKKVKGEFEK